MMVSNTGNIMTDIALIIGCIFSESGYY